MSFALKPKKYYNLDTELTPLDPELMEVSFHLKPKKYLTSKNEPKVVQYLMQIINKIKK